MHGIKSFQLGLNLYKVGMNSFHPFPTHCLVLIKTSLELLWVHLYEKFFLEQVAFIIFDFWRNFWSSTQQNYNLSRNGFIPEWNQFIPNSKNFLSIGTWIRSTFIFFDDVIFRQNIILFESKESSKGSDTLMISRAIYLWMLILMK